MKSTLILAAAAGALAQNLAGIPSCATSCIAAAVTSAGCKPTDVACQCGKAQAEIASIAAPCVIGACPADQLVSVAPAGTALCAAFSSGAATETGTTVVTSKSKSTVSATLSNNSTTIATPQTTSTGSVTLTGGNGTFTPSSPGGSSTGGSATTTGGGSGGGGSGSGSGTTRAGGATTSSNPNAAATPAILGAGALVGLLGFAAAL